MVDVQLCHLEFVGKGGEQVGEYADQIPPEREGMQQIRSPEFEAVRQYTPDVEEEAGADHAPERAGVVDEDGQPEGIFGMLHQVQAGLTGGDQDHQHRQEQGVAVDLPVEEEEDQRQGHIQQRQVEGHINRDGPMKNQVSVNRFVLS